MNAAPDRESAAPHASQGFHPSFGTRLLVLWHFFVWVLELVGQIGSLFLFIFKRQRVRAAMHALILRGNAGGEKCAAGVPRRTES